MSLPSCNRKECTALGEVGEMVVEDGDRVEEEEDWTGLEVEDQELRRAREKRMERLVREDKKRKEERDIEEREEMEMVEELFLHEDDFDDRNIPVGFDESKTSQDLTDNLNNVSFDFNNDLDSTF